MQYNGGKASVGKRWASLIQPWVSRIYWEPFGGMFGVGRHIQAPVRIYSDTDYALVTCLKAVRDGWIPPSAMTEEGYRDARERGDQDDPLYAFCAFGCSYAGKRWGGYARSGNRNYAANAKSGLLKLAPLLRGVDIRCGDYESIVPQPDWCVYADPPYANTTRVGVGKFDSDRFDSWVASMEDTIGQVFVSEYRNIPGLACVDSVKLVDGLRSKAGKSTTERLFATITI